MNADERQETGALSELDQPIWAVLTSDVGVLSCYGTYGNAVLLASIAERAGQSGIVITTAEAATRCYQRTTSNEQ